MKEIDNYKELKRTIKQLRTVNNTFSEKTSGSSCDKKGIGFCKDNRFSAFKMELSFDSWAGSFRNSNCSTVIYFSNTEIIKDYLIEYLNKDRTHLFNWIAEKIEQENEKNKTKVVSELKSLLDEVEHEPIDQYQADPNIG